MSGTPKSYSLREITRRFGGEIAGDPEFEVRRVATLENASPDSIAFLANARYLPQLKATRAGAVIVGESGRSATRIPRIVCANPYAYFARVSALFNPAPAARAAVHASAVVDPSAQVAGDAEIGACAVIEEGVKLDNQIQVGHNVRIGAHTAIAGCTGIAGSAKIGRHCRIGGASGIAGHITIADGVEISTFTLVTKSIDRPGTYTGAYAFEPHRDWLKNAAQLRHLAELAQRVRELEKQSKRKRSKP